MLTMVNLLMLRRNTGCVCSAPIAKSGAETHIPPCALDRHLAGRLAGSVDVGAMIDVDDLDCVAIEVDLVDDSVGSDSR